MSLRYNLCGASNLALPALRLALRTYFFMLIDGKADCHAKELAMTKVIVPVS